MTHHDAVAEAELRAQPLCESSGSMGDMSALERACTPLRIAGAREEMGGNQLAWMWGRTTCGADEEYMWSQLAICTIP